ncbi:Na-Ca exchanger/integrin-beta4 [Beggiatoa sp. PS]|nr:Na-Ca exchanger/integrin-beta4 [Beggiatoa sp. PS]
MISTPTGINCGGEPDTCSTSYTEGTSVTLETLARAGSLFSAWNEECNNGQVIMDADKTCTVTFQSVGKLQFSSAPTLEIDEEGGEATFTVSRIEGIQGQIFVDYSTQDETATAGKDYQATSGTLTWAAGDNEEKSFTVSILPDKLKEDYETVIVTLSNPGGGAILGTPHQSTLTITDVPWVSSLQFSMPSYAVNEGDGHVTLLVTRAGSGRWPLSVDYTAGQGTATANQDYTPVSGTLNWANNERTHKTIDIEIAHDNLEEANETFLVVLSKITGEAQFGPNTQATVNIINTPAAGSLEFSASEYGVNEYLEQITIEVNRIGGSAGAVSVNYATSDETATANEDYQTAQDQLTWGPGDMAPKSFIVPIILDNLEEPKETLTLTLSEPTGGASLGAKPEATLTIIDLSDDSTPADLQEELFPGVLQFTETSYDISERGGSVTIAVSRTVGSQGPITVNYTTEDDTALAGEEYQNSQGELTWEAGEMGEKRFSIGLFDDTIQENDKRFKVFLSNPTGGAALKNNEQSVVVNIQDNDATTLQISTEEIYLVTESTGEVIMTVTRNGNGLGEVLVDYETVDGTAKAGEDYIVTTGTLKWFSGDNYTQTVAIPIIFDRTIEANETLQFRLSNVTNGTLGTPNQVTITITESDLDNCDIDSNIAAGSIDCYVIRDQNAPALQNIKITPQGTVVGGTLGGSIQNAGWLQDVTLLPQTEIYGGTIAGHITSRDPAKPGILRYVQITAGATLENVVIGADTIIDNADSLGEGVRFENNSLVSLLPPDFDLGKLLGRKKLAILGQYAVNLSDDVLYNASINGILGAINGLPDIKNLGAILEQDEQSGLLRLEIGDLRYAVLPMKVRQILKKQVNNEIPLGVYIDIDHTVRFITHTGREIITHPVVQAPDALNKALGKLGLSEAIMLDNGNIQVPTPDGGLYFMARASLYAIRVSTETPLGIGFSSASAGTPLAYLVFEDENGDYRQQFFYPAAADSDVLYTLAGNNPDPTIHYDGQVVVQTNTNRYEGLLDYAVTKGQQRDAGTQLLDIEDVNGDGCDDSRIDYPNGDSQIIYCLP